MASPEQPADSWEDLDKLPLNKLSLQEDKAEAAQAQDSASAANSNEGRLAESEELASRSSAQSCSSSTAPQPIIDTAIRDALINQKYRLQVLRFEADVEKFVREGAEKDLTFDANLTGYQRLLCHRVAQYYGLDTSTIDEGEDQGKILARRTLITALPGVRLADVKLADSRDRQHVETPPRVLMKNRAAADRAARAAAAAANGEGAGLANSRTVQEREQDYSKARARIFGMQQDAEAGLSPSEPPAIHDGSMRAMNGRAPNTGPMSGRGRGPPGRPDQSRKAVFRNREQDLQDPDYRRGYNFPRFDPGFGEMPGMQQGMYIRPTYNSEFPELGGGMPTHSMQGPFSPGSVAHSPAGPPGLMMAGPMHPPEYMHPAALGAGGQYIPIPMQGMPYTMMGPGGHPIQAMPPGLAMPGAVHPMQGMPGMFPAHQMAFPGMPMAPAPYGFISPGQDGMPLQMPSPAIYGAYPPHHTMPYQMPSMGLEQQMQQQPPQMGNNARGWLNANSNRRNSSNQHTPRSQGATRPASAAPASALAGGTVHSAQPVTRQGAQGKGADASRQADTSGTAASTEAASPNLIKE